MMPVIHIIQHEPCIPTSSSERTETGATEVHWRSSQVKVEEFAHRKIARTCFIFAPSTVYAKSKHLRQDLSHRFQIPDWFWNERYRRSNGSFGCNDVYDSDMQAHTPQVWSRYQVKQMEQAIHLKKHTYEWYEMDFLALRSASGWTTVLCFDTPDRFRQRLFETLASSPQTPTEPDIYQLYIYLINQILNLYDESVWAIRDIVRDVEIARSQPYPTEPDFTALHDIARHAIHVSETLDTAIESLSGMIRQYRSFPEDRTARPTYEKTTFARTLQSFNFQSQVLKSLKARSDSNQARIHNEITLAFNLVAQRDSKTAIRISEAVRNDSTAMRTVATLTLAFLPATFVSAIFSTSFFNFTPAAESGRPSWTVSDKFWIYWIFATPLTIATTALWFIWQRMYVSK